MSQITVKIPKLYKFPPESIDTTKDCLFIGMNKIQKEQWLTIAVEKIIRGQTEKNSHHNGLFCVIIMDSVDGVTWMTATVKKLALEFGIMQKLKTSERMGLFIDRHVLGSSMIFIGRLDFILLAIQRGNINFNSVKFVIADINPSISWKGFNEQKLEHNFTTIMPLINTKLNSPKLTVVSYRLTQAQSKMVIANLKQGWEMYAAFPVREPAPKIIKINDIIHQINTQCDLNDKVVVLCRCLLDVKELANLPYQIGEATHLRHKMDANVLKEFEDGHKTILFITFDQFGYIDLRKVTRCLNYDMTCGEDNIYFCALNEGRNKLFQCL